MPALSFPSIAPAQGFVYHSALYSRESLTNATNSTDSELCPAGTTQALEGIAIFIAVNILAHAATVCLRPGENTSGTIRTIFGAVIWPVTAGDQAFLLLRRRISKLSQPKSPVASEKSFEDAATGSALAIFVPKRFAPLLVDKWELVGDGQHSLSLDHGRNPILDPLRKRDPQFRFNSVQHYYNFILPPTCQFPGYRSYKIYPMSSALRQGIAVLQIVYSNYKLYTTYQDSVRQNGLSSPYIVVVPYVLMSLVNLLCSAFVGFYTHVTVLPMAKDEFPPHNSEFIPEVPDTASNTCISVSAVATVTSTGDPSADESTQEVLSSDENFTLRTPEPLSTRYPQSEHPELQRTSTPHTTRPLQPPSEGSSSLFRGGLSRRQTPYADSSGGRVLPTVGRSRRSFSTQDNEDFEGMTSLFCTR